MVGSPRRPGTQRISRRPRTRPFPAIQVLASQLTGATHHGISTLASEVYPVRPPAKPEARGRSCRCSHSAGAHRGHAEGGRTANRCRSWRAAAGCPGGHAPLCHARIAVATTATASPGSSGMRLSGFLAFAGAHWRVDRGRASWGLAEVSGIRHTPGSLCRPNRAGRRGRGLRREQVARARARPFPPRRGPAVRSCRQVAPQQQIGEGPAGARMRCRPRPPRSPTV